MYIDTINWMGDWMDKVFFDELDEMFAEAEEDETRKDSFKEFEKEFLGYNFE